MDTIGFDLCIPLLTTGSQHSCTMERADTGPCPREKQQPLLSQHFLVPMGEDPAASASRGLPQI